jgi:hypothetical protein
MSPAALAASLGAGRALFGVALLAVPDRITTGWLGTADTPAIVLARCLGGRDVVVGVGTAVAAVRRREPAPWLVAGVVADLLDGAATLAAGDRIPRSGRLGTVALAAGAGLAGAWLAYAVD